MIARDPQEPRDGLQLCETSSYRPSTRKINTVQVLWDVSYVDSQSEEGQQLQAVQGAAIRKVLEWLAQNPSTTEPPAA